MLTRNKKLAVISLVLIGLFLVTVSSYAQCWMRGSHRGWSGHMIPEKYRLTEQQQQKVDDIHATYDDKILPLQRELHSKHLELEAYASRPDATVEKIKAFGKEIRNLEGKIDDLQVDAQAEAAKILTKEQRDYFGDTYNIWDMDSGWHDDCPMMRGHKGKGWDKHNHSSTGWMRERNMRHGGRW